MLPTINGKSFLDCNEEDLQIILDNPDYRENEYIDYKREFEILNYQQREKEERQKRDDAIAEFRSDVCAFANTNEGYLLFGISEKSGVPDCLLGIEIPNDDTDKFDLNIKTWLQRIEPRFPHYETKYIRLGSGKYVLVIHIIHDLFYPYLFLEDNKNYRVYRRTNNSKSVVSYMELKNMFVNSLSLEKEIELFRKERIDYLKRVSLNFIIHIFRLVL